MFRRKGTVEVEVARENEVKIGITQELSTALKMVQKENVGTEDQTVYSTDTANNVCSCIEAIFLHGLKSKAVTKIASYVGLGQEATSQPSLNFWNFVSRFTHGEVIAQLKHLGQITTEIGLCRAWVRVALNDGIMESYIDAMVSDTKNLKYFYESTAFLRDREQPGILKSYLQGLMNFEFKLSYNASVLNEWSYAPLLLAGIISSKDAPPPVIKPAGPKPKPSKYSHQEKDSETVVEVIQNKSRSGEISINLDIGDSPYNPMEQPKFGRPFDSSYYVSSSEFTSKDVEELKSISRNVKRPMSDCSSSSHMSAPDLPHMNLSPAAYVEKYGLQTASPSSCKTPESEEILRQEESIITQKIDETNAVNYTDSENFGEEEIEKDFALSNFKEDMKENSITQNHDLEESSEEFYKSPVKKCQNEKHVFGRLKRLDSINREAKEEAILNSYLDTEIIPHTEQIPEEPDKLNKVDVITVEKLESLADKIAIPEDVANVTDKGDSPNNGIDNDTNNDTLSDDMNGMSTAETNELLDASQKLLNELGIENQCDIKDVKPEITEERYSVKEMLKSKNKTKKHLESDRLKPQLSLSPPKSDIVVADLSDAVAIKVDQIRTLDNPEYLSKHRLSLPNTASVSKTDKYEPRKSLPDVLEYNSENDEEVEYSIEDHLYDGMPLNEGTDGLSRVPGVYDQTIEDRSVGKLGSREEMEDEKKVFNPPEGALKRLNDKRNSVGNNLMMTGRGWSSSFDSEAGDILEAFSQPQTTMSMPITREKSESFGSLLQNYTPASSLSPKSVDDILSNFPRRKDTVYSPQHCSSPLNQNDMSQFSSIANEKGLDAQNFQCKGCSRAIGLIFGKPRVCKFDGCYYCYECHENDEYYIPARIVHNWDFRKHKVGKKNFVFVMDKEEQPYLNIDIINPRLYEHVHEMQEIQSLRRQLMLLKTYLFTCKQSVAEDLRKLVWPRDYLFESTGLYSLADLLQVPTGALSSNLRKVIKFASKHIYGCRLCSQKGFICELCNNPKVIYAFELDATYRCPQCKTVFHKECKTENRPCPKCERRLSRQSYQGSTTVILTTDYDL
ncbi:uncharacterized protein LOC123527417 isoform X3 [Mercenaria mercenaria]|uniref:uncharacterized protein LOC123527417 isoform X3 n=1 Tax=Mercenaria mercenaria TaxID=6596 RepID=UPI00234F98B8|nr:uncharacterized protein LOC123527417 isoform X3 [Mercenaria mercenaria]